MALWKVLCTCLALGNAARTSISIDESARTNASANEGAVVIDLGTYAIKAGVLPGDTTPPLIVRSTKQVSRHKNMQQQYEERVGYGEQSVWKTEYLMQDGYPVGFDGMNELLTSVFASLGVDSSETSVILVSSITGVPKKNWEKLVEQLFETFEVQNLEIWDQATMAAISSMVLDNGLVVNIGEDVTYAMSIWSGFAIPHSKEVSKLGSRHVTDCINKKLFNGDINKIPSARGIKETQAFVAEDYDERLKATPEETPKYEMPDGSIQELGDEIFSCPEHLLNPGRFWSDIGDKGPGIIAAAVKSIKDIDIDVRRDCLANIVVTGGGANIQGLAEKVAKGIKDAFPAFDGEVKDKGSASRAAKQNMAWDGAATLASLDRNPIAWITKETYEDKGAEEVIKGKVM